MPIVSEAFDSLVDLDPVLEEIFFQHYRQIPAMRENIFNVQTSDKAKETDLRVGSFSDPVEFDGTVVYDQIDPGASITYTHRHFTRGFQVEQTMLEDMQYSGIFQQAQQMGTAFARKQEKDAASVFNNAFSSSYLGYDSKALCADDHPRSASDATAVDNLAALALTEANLFTVIQQLESLGDDLGEEISIKADLLIVGRALRKTAHEIVTSERKSGSANNDTNMYNDEGFQYMVWPFLTDTNAWFVVDSMMAKQYLKWFERISPEFAAEESFNNLLRKYRGRMRYSHGWSDFRWVVGSNPS